VRPACDLPRPRGLVRGPRPACLEDVGDGGRSDWRHGRDHAARNTLDGALSVSPESGQSEIFVGVTL